MYEILLEVPGFVPIRFVTLDDIVLSLLEIVGKMREMIPVD